MEWKSLPRASRETALFRCVKEALHFSLRSLGFSIGLTKYLSIVYRWAVCHMTIRDLDRMTSIRGSETHLIRIGCHQLAYNAAKQVKLYRIIQPLQLRQMKATIAQVHVLVNAKFESNSSPFPPELKWTDENLASRPYPLFDRFHHETDIKALAGSATPPPIQRPIRFTLIPDSITTANEAALALRHCDHLCTLMSFQTGHIKNTYALRLSLIQNLFTVVLPLPLPYNDAKKNQEIWMQPIRYETQVDMMHTLAQIANHYAACSFSIEVSRAFDATRILTMAAIVTIADAIMRQVATDIPSQFCIHYAGQAPGPTYPFCFDIGFFQVQSGLMEFTDPELLTARTQLLDYHEALKDLCHDDHRVFEFEFHNDLGNLSTLFDQLCWEIGFPNKNLHLYLSGEQSALLDYFPEMRYFRDLVFMFKYFLTPKADVFPPIKKWFQMDAKFTWRWKEGEEGRGYEVKAFNQVLQCLPSEAAVKERERKVEERSGLFAGIMGRLTRMFSSEVTRTSPSPTDPSMLAGAPIDNEDDVLHLKRCPDFNLSLSQRNSELLLSYLTVPYLRIPLIINFFASEERIKSLASPALRAVLDGVLFEPSHWQNANRKPMPDMVPFTDRSHLSTPCGLLFNELQVSPDGLLRAVTNMLQLCLDMDSGRYTDSVGSIILYVVRLVVRVEGFLVFLVKHNRADSARLSGTGWKSFVRGLSCEHVKVIDFLDRVRVAIRQKLDTAVLPMLERWVEHEVKRKKQVQLQCKFWAHMAYMYKNLESEDLNKENVSVYLCAQIFLTTRYKYGESQQVTGTAKDRKEHLKRSPMDRKEEESGRLGISETAMTNLFQRQRWKVLKWLEANKTDANEVFEGVVRVVTFTGSRRKGENSILTARQWKQTQGPMGIGRFYPYVRRKKGTKKADSVNLDGKSEDLGEKAEEETDDDSDDAEDVQDANADVPASASPPSGFKKLKGAILGARLVVYRRKNHDNKESYEKFLRDQQDKQRGATEVNIQLGEFTLKTMRLEVLSERFMKMPDFLTVFGDMRGGVQCADVKKTTNLHWVRLVGHRHDLMHWQPDTRTPDMGVFTRSYSPDLHADEMWIVHSLEPVRSKHLHDFKLFLPETRHNKSATVARLQGYANPASPAADKEEKIKSRKVPTIKEIVVFRNPRVVHVYNIVEHGRVHYRSLVYSSDARFCLHDMEPRLTLAQEWNVDQFRPRYESGDPRTEFEYEESLVITRSLDTLKGTETFIPARLLYGLLPTALLETYLFWKCDLKDNLLGVEKVVDEVSAPTFVNVTLAQASKAISTGKVVRSMQHIKPNATFNTNINVSEMKRNSTGIDMELKDERADESKNIQTGDVSDPLTYATSTDKAELPVAPTHVTHDLVLLNMMYAPPGTLLFDLANLLMRIENLSHCLAWARTDSTTVDLIELPRLRLSFVAKTVDLGNGATTLLYSRDHDGLFISNYRDSMIQKLLEGVPHSLLLENVDHELFMLVPGAALPIRPSIVEDRFPTEIVFDRNRSNWLSNLEVRHYLYPIHKSKSFLFTPTLASALYLLLLRFLNRQYSQVFQLAGSCVTDGTLSMEENQIFDQLEFVKNDFHADAHACRLKIWLATVDTKMNCPWDITSEMEFYLAKHGHVSAACRLTIDEELAVLESCKRRSCELVNRYRYLQAIVKQVGFIDASIPSRPRIEFEFDTVIDKTIITEQASFFEALSTTSYLRPVHWNDERKIEMYYTGAECMRLLNLWLSQGFYLSGGKADLGFLFFYELMTNTLPFGILAGDSTFNLAYYLVRMMPPSERQAKGVLMSALRTLMSNPHLVQDSNVPKFQDTRGRFKIATMFNARSDYGILMNKLRGWLVTFNDTLVWPIKYEIPPLPKQVAVTENVASDRMWLSDTQADYLCSRAVFKKPTGGRNENGVGMTLQEYEAFMGAPLSVIGLDRFVVFLDRAQRGLPVISNVLPFDIPQSCGQTHVALSMLRRLASDTQVYAAQENKGVEAGFVGLLSGDVDKIVANPSGPEMTAAMNRLQLLIDTLEKLQSDDSAYLIQAIAQLLSLATVAVM